MPRPADIPEKVTLSSDWETDLPYLTDGNDPPTYEPGTELQVLVKPGFDEERTFLRLSSLGADAGLAFVEGRWTLRVTQAELVAALPPGNWVWLVRLLEPDSFVRELFRGSLIALPGRV